MSANLDAKTFSVNTIACHRDIVVRNDTLQIIQFDATEKQKSFNAALKGAGISGKLFRYAPTGQLSNFDRYEDLAVRHPKTGKTTTIRLDYAQPEAWQTSTGRSLLEVQKCAGELALSKFAF